MSKEKVVCFTCKKIFDKDRYEIKHTKHNFCSRNCYSKWMATLKGEDKISWKGDIKIRKDGRVLIRIPNHPRAISGIVHHIDQNPRNNEVKNLHL